MKRASAAIMVILLAGSLGYKQAWAAGAITTESDGWHTWQIEASGNVSTWCCFSSRSGGKTHPGCNLDGRSISLSNNGDCASGAGQVQIYARINQGEPEIIRVLSSACPVTTDTKVTDHGTVTIEQNIAWFRKVIENPRVDPEIRQEALFALVQTETDAAFEYIDTLLAEK